MAESQCLRPPARSSNGRGQGTGPDTKVTLFTSSAVAGAMVRTLSRAIEVDYFNLGVPLDLFVCVGLNDVMRGRSPLEIICDLTMLQEALEAPAHLNHYSLHLAAANQILSFPR